MSQKRDDQGRYDYDGRMDRVCVCGGTLGIHAASAPHECLAHSVPPDYFKCACPKFRESKSAKRVVTHTYLPVKKVDVGT